MEAGEFVPTCIVVGNYVGKVLMDWINFLKMKHDRTEYTESTCVFRPGNNSPKIV
jgi:hypothetical protein